MSDQSVTTDQAADPDFPGRYRMQAGNDDLVASYDIGERDDQSEALLMLARDIAATVIAPDEPRVAEHILAGTNDGCWAVQTAYLALEGSTLVGGIAEIAFETHWRIDQEGWRPEHDDRHVDGALALAAALYAKHATVDNEGRKVVKDWPPADWPWAWDASWWKPKDRRRDLARAGALLAAEIDRLDRLNDRQATGGE